MRSNISQFSSQYDAILIGAGHNGLTCRCYLAKAGLRVLVLEEYCSIGGMTITEEITLRGFKSDIHTFGYQLANTSPVPEELGLNRFGFELFYPQISFSHIFPNVSNIYLCGSGSHPGPGVSMAPGRNAAQVILRDLEIDFRSMVAL